MNKHNLLCGLAVLTFVSPEVLGASELQAAALKAWNDYVAGADARMQSRADGKRSFLWSDESPTRNTLQHPGEPVVSPAFGNGVQSVPGALIHHWVGAVFIPNITITDLRAVMSDFDRYKEFYSPVVVESKSLGSTDSGTRFVTIWHHRALFIEAAMEAQYQSRAFTVDARHAYNLVTTTQVREIESYRQKGQRLLPPDTGNGFIWRLHTIARYEERDGGVHLEVEAMALTRDMPSSLRWLIAPIVARLSVNSLTTCLRQTRDAVLTSPRRTAAQLSGK